MLVAGKKVRERERERENFIGSPGSGDPGKLQAESGPIYIVNQRTLFEGTLKP